MQGMGKLFEGIEKIIPQKTASIEDMLHTALGDEDIKKFIESNEINADTIQTFRSTLIIYHQRKQAGEALELSFERAYKGDIIDVREIKEPFKPKRIAKLETDMMTDSLRGLRFKDLEVDEYNEKLIGGFKRLVDGYEDSEPKQGIWLNGAFGRGKTYLLGALANELHAAGVNVIFISPKTFIDTYTAMPFAEKEGYLKRVSSVEVLILDDVGQEHLSEYGVKIMYELMAVRYANKSLTFVSSNLTISEYIQSLAKANRMDAERLNERLKHLCKQYRLGGNNRRDK